MIGVIASEDSQLVVREFFELFKTPWEFAKPNAQYAVAIVIGEDSVDIQASLLFVYSKSNIEFDREQGIATKEHLKVDTVANAKIQFPVYRSFVTIEAEKAATLLETSDGNVVAVKFEKEGRSFIRVGYDLLEEIKFLVDSGQPEEYASIPTLDFHIAFLRSRMVEHGLEFAEIPPVPEGYAFTVCLSHDVDHPKMKFHNWDHTMIGFLYRASIGSLSRFASGRLSLMGVLKNWVAVFSLPFARLGLAADCWDSSRRYFEIEGDRGSTFFVIPFKGVAGKNQKDEVRSIRASPYGAADISAEIKEIIASGREVGVHGLNAWREVDSGKAERREIANHRLSNPEEGVRMHWLYFDDDSHKKLEEAGFTYDSTVGYNTRPGYRAGTSQVYKPLSTDTLLEIPLHIMDTSLFYPSYLYLSEGDARNLVSKFHSHAVEYGGIITVNWHDRSLAPERQWDGLYKKMNYDWAQSGGWFPTMGQAAAWSRKRRSVDLESFSVNEFPKEEVLQTPKETSDKNFPGLIWRIHNSPSSNPATAYEDRSFNGPHRCLQAN